MKHAGILLLCLMIAATATAQETLWGMAAARGTTNGTVFRTDSAGNGYIDVYTFSDTSLGIEPYGSLIQASDGMLYGLTSRGGALGFGVLFQINPLTGVYTKKHDFDSVNGRTPFGSLVEAPNGKLYGMTNAGGALIWPAKDRGVIFEFDPATNVFTKKKDLLPKNAAWAYGSLVLGPEGHLYGLSSAGGVDGAGMVFQYNYVLDSFSHFGSFISGPAWEGYAPRGSMTFASNGFFYGFSRYGQALGSGGGVVFRFDASIGIWDRMSSVYKFSELDPDSANGYELLGSPIQATDGNLYGMTVYGGSFGAGTLFSYDFVANTFTKLHDFNPDTDGYAPFGTLTQASNSMLYGLTTSEGGQARLFQYNILTGEFTVKANVTGTPYYTALTKVTTPPAHVISMKEPSSWTVFPNPTHDQLVLSIDDLPANSTYQLQDEQSRIVLAGNAKRVNTLDISHLPAGIYTLVVRAGLQVSSKTIIKN